jgi:hypothetical protein
MVNYLYRVLLADPVGTTSHHYSVDGITVVIAVLVLNNIGQTRFSHQRGTKNKNDDV